MPILTKRSNEHENINIFSTINKYTISYGNRHY